MTVVQREAVDDGDPAPSPGRRAVLAALIGGAIAVGLGVWALADGVSQLRWAHLYRQRTNEGLGFFPVFSGLFIGGFLVVAGATALKFGGRVLPRPIRLGVRTVIALIIAALVLAFGVTAFVESHGDRCIGPCGPALVG